MNKIVCILDMHTEFIKKNSVESKMDDTTDVTSMKEIVGWC